MARLEIELRAYATELAIHVPGGYSAEDFYDFLRNLYNASVRHHGEETVEQMSDETVLKVLKSQVRELIQLKRIGKLLVRRDRI
ncbi:hypothetical protein [Tumebacillus permanentifrigoris]|uniref:Uncharacterized protein n=1 Tax=Tumebacillus permanentifrigoris TaxID=378543 RepID=A0A316DVD0_9BACL|nr:hypothetical protein [Tumebacillus permanentifrigoris]PWK13152.1 hypothetical protein C7459_108172 [Tumebacillus permanentifrigoris]